MDNALAPLPTYISDAGLWVGLIVTLLIFSLLAGDNLLARVAQHLLVGAGMGYALLMAVRYVLSPQLLAPLARGEWIAQTPLLVLALLLIAATLERIFAQGGEQGSPAQSPGRGRQLLHGAGAIPLAIVLGVGIATALVGLVQGTLFVQILTVVQNTFREGKSGSPLWIGLLTLLLTTGTLLHLTVSRSRQIDLLPRPLRDLLGLWVWIGERALWIATGVILARLFAARLTLLVDRLDWIAATVQATGLWQWLLSIWQNLTV